MLDLTLLKSCQSNHHERCINLSKKCECDCHQDKNKPRDIRPLLKVNIIPQTYCSKCLHDYKVELDFCKICDKHLVRVPNYYGDKVRYNHCMGSLDYILWQQRQKEGYEKQKKLEEERDHYWWYTPPTQPQQSVKPPTKTKPQTETKTTKSSWKFWKNSTDIDYQ